MGIRLRNRWFIGAITGCSLIGVCILFLLHAFTDESRTTETVGLGDFLVKRTKGNVFRLVTDDSRTIITAPWPETVRNLRLCKKLSYDSHGQLPKASVITTFHNTETISSLLQTIHSILQRTPEDLLQEIVVIDDCSKKDDLGQVLDIYLATVFPPKVKLYRNPVNIGLIRSRLRGSRLSEGEVIVFMDSHSEVQPGWLEPLLYEIKKNRRTLAHSFIDWMEKKDDVWHYRRGGADWVVYFDWRLVFGWQPIPKQMKQRKSTDTLRSKVIIGAYAAIDRKFFEEIGELDEGMEFWGGENIELSLRVWLFGGQVLSVPCSRVAHLEGRDTRSYRDSFTATIERNYKRVVEVWFDEYKRYFYLYYPSLIPVDAGNLTDRMNVKSRAKFNFHWFLQNVFPELGIPDRDGFAWGTLRNSKRDLCVKFTSSLALSKCSDHHSQIFYWSNKFEFRTPVSIFNLKSEQDENNAEKRIIVNAQYLPFYNNDLANKWLHWKNGPLLETKTHFCMSVASSLKRIEMIPCDYTNNPDQLWEFQYYTDQYQDMIAGHSFVTTYREQRLSLIELKSDRVQISW